MHSMTDIQIAGAAFLYLAEDQSKWSQATFGTDQDRGPMGALKHLVKEANEAQEKIDDPFEYADCLLLVLDAARRAGIPGVQLLHLAQQKMEVNKTRTWPKPTSDEPVEHVREYLPAKITINGREVKVESFELTYDQIVSIAFNSPPTVSPLTVAFGAGRLSGIVAPGESVTVVDGMNIDVADTSNA